MKNSQGNCPWENSIAMETNGFSGGKQCVFTSVNENSYAPTAWGSYVWTAIKVTISDAYIFIHPQGMLGNFAFQKKKIQ